MSEPTTIEHAIAAARPAEQRPLAAELATLALWRGCPSNRDTPLLKTPATPWQLHLRTERFGIHHQPARVIAGPKHRPKPTGAPADRQGMR